jgi:large subunit ribosomal protein L10
VEQLASLPTLEQALGMLAGVMIAPVVKLVRTLNEPVALVARAVNAVAESKKAA